MHTVRAFLFVVCIASIFVGCDRDDTMPTVNPTIDFSTDAGFTFLGDTVALSDTLRVGVRINKGDDGLNTFKVLSSYDGASEVVVDSLSIGSSSFAFDKVIITRAIPGTEKWVFWVQETDGDVIRRALTFIVQ
jgi:hypothetical protein